MAIKISIFATPIFMVYEEIQTFREVQEIRKEFVGNWIGKVTKTENDKIIFNETKRIKIDSAHIYFDCIYGLDEKYKFFMDYPEYGHITKEYFDYELSIKKQGKDSLIIKIYDLQQKYEFRLKHEN